MSTKNSSNHSPSGKLGYPSLFSLAKAVLDTTPTDDYTLQLLRSFIVSIIAVIVNLSGSLILKEGLGVNYILATTISFYLGVIVNYVLSIKWVFAHSKLSSRHAEFAIFVVITTVGWAFNELIIAGMVDIVKTGFLSALITATVIVFFWNFLARKKFLYH